LGIWDHDDDRGNGGHAVNPLGPEPPYGTSQKVIPVSEERIDLA
jgi:hypothetical protein